MKSYFLILIFFLYSVVCVAQVTGPDSVCAGTIYTYNANIPGATTFTWTVPASWYGLTGQGTPQISITCNANDGQVCVEGFDSIGISLGTQCLATQLGGSGGNWHLDPTGFNAVCGGSGSVYITPTIVPDAGGGGLCLLGCSVSGIPHPNIIWGLYQGQTLLGIIGTTFSVGLGNFYAAHVDTTLGPNFPQAIQIIDGCGGVGNSTFSIGQIGLMAIVDQFPDPVCIGDTLLLLGNGMISGVGNPWTGISGLTPITSVSDIYQLQAIVTSMSASVTYTIHSEITGGLCDGCICDASTTYSVNVINCNVSASFQSTATSICENTCINFTNTSSNATSYQWSFPGASPDSSTDVNPTNICYGTSGSYDVLLIANNVGQSDTLLLPGFITVIAPPQAGFSAIDTNFCSAQCIDFTNASLNATSYLWNFQNAIPSSSTDVNPQNICYSTAGNFEVSLICTNSGCSDTITLTDYISVNPSPQSAITASPLSFCPGSCTDFINLSTNATAYQWNFPGATIDTSTLENPSGICYNTSGQYNVMLVSSNGDCTDTLSLSNYITVYPQPPLISILVANDSLITNQGFTYYQWYINSNMIPAATDYFYIALANGDYNVVATDSNGCEVEAAIFNVMVNIETFLPGRGINIVPNPFSGKISFRPVSSSSEKISIIVLNNIGEKLFEKQTTFIDQEIDLSFLEAGFYMLTVQTDEGIISRRIVKM